MFSVSKDISTKSFHNSGRLQETSGVFLAYLLLTLNMKTGRWKPLSESPTSHSPLTSNPHLIYRNKSMIYIYTLIEQSVVWSFFLFKGQNNLITVALRFGSQGIVKGAISFTTGLKTSKSCYYWILRLGKVHEKLLTLYLYLIKQEVFRPQLA